MLAQMREKQFLSAFGGAVKQVRLDRALTQEALAERAGIHPTYVSMIERGTNNASILVAARIAAALGLSLSELFAVAENRRSGSRAGRR